MKFGPLTVEAEICNGFSLNLHFWRPRHPVYLFKRRFLLFSIGWCRRCDCWIDVGPLSLWLPLAPLQRPRIRLPAIVKANLKRKGVIA